MKDRMDFAGLLAVFAAALCGYLLTICPTVYNGDSGDFITASYFLGIPHPSGYPLYMILGKAFSLLPVGSVAYRYNLMSAVAAAGISAVAYLCLRLLGLSIISSAGGGLLVAFSVAVWDQATVAEAYNLNGFLNTLTLYLLLKYRAQKDNRFLLYAALCFGVSMTNHVSSALYLPAYTYLAYSSNKKALKKLDVRKAILAAIAPLTLYLYLPIRASMKPLYNWGNPDNIERFINHVTAVVHRQVYVLTYTKEQVFERFFSILVYYLRQFSLLGALPIFGLYRQGGENRAFLNFTALMVGADFFYTLFLNDVSLEITTFCIPSIIVLGMWSGFGIQDLLANVRQRTKSPRAGPVIVAAVVLALFAANYHISDKSRNLIAYDWSMNVLKSVEDNAVIFVQGDNVVFPISYLHMVENIRPNVTIYEQTGYISHGLYGQDYVGLDEKAHAQRQMQREYEVISSGRPVYYSSKPLFDYPGYRVDDAGLIYKIVPENSPITDSNSFWERYDFRDIANTTINMDYMSRQIWAMYYVRLAQYHLSFDKDKAAYLLKQVLQYLPDNTDVRYDLGNIYLGQGKYQQAIEEFRKVLKTDPRKEKVLNNLGYANMLAGDKDQAKINYMMALSANPEYNVARANLAGMLMAEGKFDEATKHYYLIIKSEPTNSKAYYNLGNALFELKDYEQATKAWNRFIQLEPTSQYLPQLRAAMQKIQARNNSTTSPTKPPA